MDRGAFQGVSLPICGVDLELNPVPEGHGRFWPGNGEYGSYFKELPPGKGEHTPALRVF